ncbi:CBS domain-containing protein [Thalassotalea sp. M1531]|uniref:CBS domain-containing protein n=1 Tax=Thalassotalea algicola TaxID=2716224 RepID=A0A7Y0LAY4_9GAMM|nr:CBS domain-containing protein [Thalassotalea algicola]NMP30997.1 CBS domain-containing protein [Thalassotalea algicola]
MNISSIMSTKLITLTIDSTLGDAKDIFEKHTIHHILILDDDKQLSGLITDRDLYKHLSPTIGTAKESHDDLAMLKKKVHQIMTRDIVAAPTTLAIKDAIVWFDDNHISCLPVINEKQLVGIISWRDIVKVLAQVHRQNS